MIDQNIEHFRKEQINDFLGSIIAFPRSTDLKRRSGRMKEEGIKPASSKFDQEAGGARQTQLSLQDERTDIILTKKGADKPADYICASDNCANGTAQVGKNNDQQDMSYLVAPKTTHGINIFL